MNKQAVTIYDIAKEANVSPSTVSRVINDKPGVRREIRERVRVLLDKNDFHPNEIARSLVSTSVNIIGILIPDLFSSHYTECVFLLEKELSVKGYFCLIMSTGLQESEQARYIHILQQRNVSAAILIGSTFQNSSVLEAIQKNLPRIPVVMINGFLPLGNVYGIVSDEEGGVADSVNFLVSKGRRNLAFVRSARRSPSDVLKETGFHYAVMGSNAIDEYRIIETDDSTSSAEAATAHLLQKFPNVDGIIYSTDFHALAGLRAIHQRKIQVPRDIAVIGIDNSILAQMAYPALTSIDNKLPKSTSLAIHLIEDHLAGKGSAIHHIKLETELIEREST